MHYHLYFLTCLQKCLHECLMCVYLTFAIAMVTKMATKTGKIKKMVIYDQKVSKLTRKRPQPQTVDEPTA